MQHFGSARGEKKVCLNIGYSTAFQKTLKEIFFIMISYDVNGCFKEFGIKKNDWFIISIFPVIFKQSTAGLH